MSVFRVWQISQFELTRLFATKRGLLALAAFAMVWFMILKYPIGHAVPFLNSQCLKINNHLINIEINQQGRAIFDRN